jgi:hypothetical protein
MRHATSKAVVVSHKHQALPLACVMGVALLAFATTTAQAQSTGIATCDDFLTKYETCVTSKLPDAQRATYKAQLDQMRKSWVDMSKNPATKPTMEASCKQSMDAMKTALQSYGCTF